MCVCVIYKNVESRFIFDRHWFASAAHLMPFPNLDDMDFICVCLVVLLYLFVVRSGNSGRIG